MYSPLYLRRRMLDVATVYPDLVSAGWP